MFTNLQKYYNVVLCVHNTMSSRTRQKTVTRTIRIPSHLDAIIHKDSKEKRSTANALVSSILTKYAEWDRYTESFGFISLPRSGLKLIMQSLDDEAIKQIAGQIGASQSRELIMFFFKKISLDTFVSAISLFSKYAGFGSYEIESNGQEHTVVLHHELGRKWSIYVAYLMSEGLKSTLGISPRFQIAENSVIFELFIP
jgi:hypothetical protein